MNMKITKLKQHKLNIKIYGNEIVDNDLVENIKTHGVLVPLTVKKDGTIISGHRRFKAIKETNITEVPVNIVEFGNELDEKEAIINYNKQRIKTYSQMDAEADMLEVIEKERAKIRQIEKLKKGKERDVCSDVQNSAHRNKGTVLNQNNTKTRDIVAKKVGFGSHDTRTKFQKIKAIAKPEVIKQLDKGEITINKAYQDIKKAEKRKEIIEKTVDVQVKTESIDIYNTEKKYRVIYADPPWSYGNNMPEYVTEQKDHYKLMKLDDICNMPIKNIIEKNAILFLWVTSPILEESFEVIKSWGFKYKSSFVWDKVKHNMGHYNSVRHELLLIATKGSCTPDNIKLFDSVYSEERTQHSVKPDFFREIIDTLYIGNKIELFARKKNKGWDFYGNELGAKI